MSACFGFPVLSSYCLVCLFAACDRGGLHQTWRTTRTLLYDLMVGCDLRPSRRSRHIYVPCTAPGSRCQSEKWLAASASFVRTPLSLQSLIVGISSLSGPNQLASTTVEAPSLRHVNGPHSAASLDDFHVHMF